MLRLLEWYVENCLYLYMDIINMDKEKGNVELWISGNDDDPDIVLLRYYESFQVFSASEDTDLRPAADLISGYGPEMIAGQERVIKRLSDLIGAGYEAEYGKVYEMFTKMKIRDTGSIALASAEDAEEIAALIQFDAGLGEHYGDHVLAKQIGDRIRNKTGRSYVIREGGRIIAHTATYAETDALAIVSGTIVHPDYRNKGYYPVISNYILSRLIEEGKRVFTFAVEPKISAYHDRAHRICGHYGRLTKRQM